MRALAAALSLVALARSAAAAEPGVPSSPAPVRAASPTVVASYDHDLSTPSGVVALTWANLTYDRSRAETFVVAEGFVRIFDASGMETYRFGDDGSLGSVLRVAVQDDGGLVVLTSKDGKRVLLRCDYKGEPVGPLTLKDVPTPFADLEPDELVQRNGLLYLAERGTMRVLVTDLDGTYRRSYDLRRIVAAGVPADADPKPATHMDGFNVDAWGNLLFTSSTMFAAGIVSPAGDLRLFGARGSTPGRFNNVGGIDADEKGNLYVTDRLRSVVSVWSPALKHLGEFGYRGWDTTNLITPYGIAAGNGRVFVSQAARRGVRVFRVRIVRVVEEDAAGSGAEAPPPLRPGGGGP
jgi:hypothetical protein